MARGVRWQEERESQSAKDVIVVADNYAMSAMRSLNVTQQKRTQQDVTPRRACPVTEIGLTLAECSRDACALQRREGGLSVSPSGGRFAAEAGHRSHTARACAAASRGFSTSLPVPGRGSPGIDPVLTSIMIS